MYVTNRLVLSVCGVLSAIVLVFVVFWQFFPILLSGVPLQYLLMSLTAVASAISLYRGLLPPTKGDILEALALADSRRRTEEIDSLIRSMTHEDSIRVLAEIRQDVDRILTEVEKKL